MTGRTELRKQRRLRGLFGYALLSVALYGALAYLAFPEYWTYRERDAAVGAFLTRTPQGIPGDPINLRLEADRRLLIRAFAAAGWTAADALTWRTAAEIGESVLLDRRYAAAPVSTLLYEGRAQQLAFEKDATASPDSRHHVRFWPAERPDAWFGAATFDRDVGFSHDTGQVTHHIASDIDAERDGVLDQIAAAGFVGRRGYEDGVGATMDGRNGGGDLYVTDGRIGTAVLVQPRTD